jgi:hypothetical protein
MLGDGVADRMEAITALPMYLLLRQVLQMSGDAPRGSY